MFANARLFSLRVLFVSGLIASASLQGLSAGAAPQAPNARAKANAHEATSGTTVAQPLIYSIAGNDIPGAGGDFGLATQANLNYPMGTALDNAGNLYIADELNNTIRKVVLSTGVITTVVGTGAPGYAGDGGPAVNALLDYPSGVSVDSAGNLYIADTLNFAIRKVDVNTKNISTIVGNGIVGNLGEPFGVTVDSKGNLFIADYAYSVVWEVPAGSSTMKIFAGNENFDYKGDGGLATAAALQGPTDVAVDAAGNVYIADEYNNVVRMVSAKTGIITTYAGNGTGALSGLPGYSGDGGPATQAELNNPNSIALDSNNNLYIADTYNNVIRLVTASNGIINTIAGNGPNCIGYNGDGGPAPSAELCDPQGVRVDSSGNVYIADSQNYAIREVVASSAGATAATATPVFSITSGSYSGPQVASISDATPGAAIYVTYDGSAPTADSAIYNGPIHIDGTITLSAIAIAPGSLASPAATEVYTFTTRPPLIISTIAGTGVKGFKGAGGQATGAQLGYPYDLVRDVSGNLYAADYGNSVVWRIDGTTGIITVVAGTGTAGFSGDNGPATSAQLNAPYAVALDAAGNLYIGDTSNHAVRKVAAATGIITTIAGTGGSHGYTGNGGPATAAKIYSPQGLAFDSAGNLYIAETSNRVVRKITMSTGMISVFAGTHTGTYSGDGGPATSAGLTGPQQLAFNSAGDLYIQGGNRIRKVAVGTGIITTVAGNGDPGFSGDGGPATKAEIYPRGISVDASGILYISNLFGAIRIVPPGTGIITSLVGNGYCFDNGDGGSALSAGICAPHGIAFDGAGGFYFNDMDNSKIRRVTPPPALITPAITWPPPASIPYGAALSTTQLDATTTVGGTFAYNPQAGTVLPAGTQTLQTTFTPTDTLHYATATDSVSLQVNKATPTASLQSSASSVFQGVSVTLTATLTGTSTAPTGSVNFLNGATSLGSGTLNSSGVATLTLNTLPVANYSVTASYAGDSNYNSATSTAVSVAVIPKPTPAIKLGASSGSVTYGASVTLTATMTGAKATPTGTVIFLDGTAQLGSGTLNGSGVATYATTALTGGSHSITASYAGDANYGAATSTAVTVTVGKASQTITFTPLATTATYGVSPITLAATASSQLPVSFSVTGPAAVNGTSLIITGAGSVALTASQAGNGNYSAATPVLQTIKVNKATPTAVLTSSEASGPYGASVTLTATLTGAGAAPTGSVTFKSGSTSLGTGTLNSSGVATLTLSTLAIGADSLTASYPGDTNYNTATSVAITVTVSKAAQTINFTAPASPVSYGVSPISLVASATSGLTVSFSATGPGTVSGSTLTITGVGSVLVTANQAGNGNYAAAAPVQQTIVVNGASSAIALKTSAASGAYGTSVTFTATVTGSAVKPTGTVNFLNGSASLGTGTLNSSGVATLAITTLPVGSDSITASYPGDSHYSSATSTAVAETISQGTATVKLTSSSTAPAFGTSVTLTATVTGGGAKPTGSVTFLNGSTSLGAGTVNSSGVATLAVTTLPVGKDSVTASYGGDGNYATAASTATAITVAKGSQTITFTLPTTATYGASPTILTATASSGLTVTFGVTGPATLNGNTLIITGAGSVMVTASQPGNGNYNAATAVSQTIKVAKATAAASLTASSTSVASGTSVTFTATLTGAGSAPTGTVTFLDGKTSLGTGTLNAAGVATLSTAKLAAGAHPVTASYGGDTNYNTATSSSVTVTVTK